MTDRNPNAGSPEAIAAGCTCPIFDNHHGAGALINGKRHWWQNADCPLHGWQNKGELVDVRYITVEDWGKP